MLAHSNFVSWHLIVIVASFVKVVNTEWNWPLSMMELFSFVFCTFYRVTVVRAFYRVTVAWIFVDCSGMYLLIRDTAPHAGGHGAGQEHVRTG